MHKQRATHTFTELSDNEGEAWEERFREEHREQLESIESDFFKRIGVDQPLFDWTIQKQEFTSNTLPNSAEFYSDSQIFSDSEEAHSSSSPVNKDIISSTEDEEVLETVCSYCTSTSQDEFALLSGVALAEGSVRQESGISLTENEQIQPGALPEQQPAIIEATLERKCRAYSLQSGGQREVGSCSEVSVLQSGEGASQTHDEKASKRSPASSDNVTSAILSEVEADEELLEEEEVVDSFASRSAERSHPTVHEDYLYILLTNSAKEFFSDTIDYRERGKATKKYFRNSEGEERDHDDDDDDILFEQQTLGRKQRKL